jgi:chemosensory pili system protein ChpA (sensor histidine kinase/response regulator)
VYTDNDLAKMKSKGLLDSDDENQEKSLRWLLEMDLSEPEERLFTVAGNEYSDAGLSALEAEVAGRPMIRGNADSDDLASYVDEEIVITSAGEANDIYARSDTADVDERARTSREEVMSIEFSREWEDRDTGAPSSVEEGADILGLAGDDDIGEKFLSITRVKSTVVSNEKDERAATTEAISDQTTDTTEDLAETTLEAEGDEGLEVGDFESIDVENTNDEAIAITLTGAPVTTLVADPGVDIVANDSESEDGLEHISVLDYVANMPQPEDDDEFDSYLLGGEHLVDDGTDPDELVIQRTEGIVAVDPSTEVSIDYHEDFSSMEGFERDDVAEIAAVIAPVMDEISRDVRARLESLGLAADAIVVDVKLGSDEESIKQCYAQGYEPAYAICSEMPQPMRALDQSAREAIYVRLMHAESGKTWNDLFGEDFVALIDTDTAHEDHTDALTDIDVQSAESIEAEAVLTVDDALGDGFGEDIFGDDFTDDFADDFAADLMGDDHLAAADIEAAFSSLSQGEDVDDDIDGVSFEDVQENVDDSEVVTTELEEDLTVEAAIPVELEAHEQEEGEEEGEIFATRYEFEDEVQEAAPFDGTRLGGFIPDYIDFSYTSQSNTEIFADFLDAFIEEGSVEVEKLENEVGEWEKNVESEPLFANVSRTLHTIKGIAKGVGLQRLGTLVHNFETLLDKMPRPNEDEEQAYFRIVNVWLDAVVRGVEFVAENRADIATEFPVQGTDSQSGQAPEVEASEATDSVGAEVAATEVVPAEIKVSTTSALEKKRDQQLADEGAKVLAAQQSVRITSEKLDHLLNLTSQAQQLGVRASQNTTRSKRSSAELQARLSSVRTHIRKIADRALLNVNARPGSTTPDLDALEMDQYSELQEAASILREGVEDLTDLVEVVSRQNILIEALLKQQSSVISGISSSIQGARVVPVSRLMPGLRRIVRTVSTDLGKVVSFNVLNETGALDRDHYARLQVILEHMVRNALDHGIESPDERVAMGKPTGGRVTIDVRKSGGDYLIRLSDDGKGIDPDAIRESAYEKGLDIDVEALSDDEAIRLIFHKGFTTASTLSEISGRGVGMDIVLTELQQIGGDIQIQSAVGLGTAFEVRIPSNVSVNGALLVAAANESYAIPLNGLISVEQVPVDEFFAAVEAGGTLPISDMECEPAYLGTLCQGVGLPDRSVWDTFVPVIIAGSADRYMAIAIDNLEEALELVVRSLGSQFSTVPGVAGAATTAEGEAIVALDLNLLVSSAGADGVAPSAESRAESTTLLALVVDDSRTQRMVATSQLDTVGVETVTAENGLVAIDLLNASHRLPDVILLDVEMPVKDGIQTLREIRKSRRYGHLPVIMVTSRTGTKHRALAHDAGCSAYMGKPFNFPALIKQINELTGHDLQLS